MCCFSSVWANGMDQGTSLKGTLVSSLPRRGLVLPLPQEIGGPVLTSSILLTKDAQWSILRTSWTDSAASSVMSRSPWAFFGR